MNVAVAANGVSSINQTGGMTAGTVNVGPPPITIFSSVGPMSKVKDPANSAKEVYAYLVQVKPDGNWFPIAIAIEAEMRGRDEDVLREASKQTA
jgi:hypothetical protein